MNAIFRAIPIIVLSAAVVGPRNSVIKVSETSANIYVDETGFLADGHILGEAEGGCIGCSNIGDHSGNDDFPFEVEIFVNCAVTGANYCLDHEQNCWVNNAWTSCYMGVGNWLATDPCQYFDQCPSRPVCEVYAPDGNDNHGHPHSLGDFAEHTIDREFQLVSCESAVQDVQDDLAELTDLVDRNATLLRYNRKHNSIEVLGCEGKRVVAAVRAPKGFGT